MLKSRRVGIGHQWESSKIVLQVDQFFFLNYEFSVPTLRKEREGWGSQVKGAAAQGEPACLTPDCDKYLTDSAHQELRDRTPRPRPRKHKAQRHGCDQQATTQDVRDVYAVAEAQVVGHRDQQKYESQTIEP